MNAPIRGARCIRRPGTAALLFGLLGPALAFAQAGAGPQYSPADLATAADAAAQVGDTKGLRELSGQGSAESYSFVRSPGAFGAGTTYSWRVDLLKSPANGIPNQIVFHTPYVAHDVGQRVFVVMTNNGQYGIGAELPAAQPIGFAIQSHDMTVRFDLPEHKAIFLDRIRAIGTRKDAPFFSFRLSDECVVTSIKRDGKPLAFGQAGGVVVTPTPEGDSFQLDVTYEAVLTHAGFNGYVGPDEVMLTGNRWWPAIAGIPAPMHLRVESPPGWTAVATGDYIGKAGGSDAFETRLPTCTFALSVGPYTVTRRTVGSRTYAVLQLKPNATEAQRQLALLPEVFAFFNRFMPYPWKRFSLVESPNAPATPFSASSVLSCQGPLSAREMVRGVSLTWWAGLAPADYLVDFHAETIAEYTTGLYFRERPVGSRVELRLAGRTRSLGFRQVEPGGVSEVTPLTGAESFAFGLDRGAKELEVLEDQIGTTGMMRALMHYVQDAPLTRPALWTELERAVMPDAHGKGEALFDQLVRARRNPTFSLKSARYDAKKKAVTGRIAVEEALAVLKVPVGVLYADGSLKESAFPAGGGETAFTIPSGKRPLRAILDPYDRLYRKLEPAALPTTIADLQPDAIVAIPNSLSAEIGSLSAKLRRCMGPVQVKPESQVTADDLRSHDVVFYGPGAHPLLEQVSAKFPISESAGLLLFHGTVSEQGSAAAISVRRSPTGSGRLIGRMFGSADAPLWTMLASTAVCDKFGRTIRAETLPITTGPDAVRVAK